MHLQYVSRNIMIHVPWVIGLAAAFAVCVVEHVPELLAPEHVHEEVGRGVDAGGQVGEADGGLDEVSAGAHALTWIAEHSVRYSTVYVEIVINNTT